MSFQIEHYIPNGQTHAIPAKWLADMLHIKKRELRLLIEQAHDRGIAVCSCTDAEGGGYYMPETKAEAMSYIKMQDSRIRKAEIARQCVLDVLDSLPEG